MYLWVPVITVEAIRICTRDQRRSQREHGCMPPSQ